MTTTVYKPAAPTSSHVSRKKQRVARHNDDGSREQQALVLQSDHIFQPHERAVSKALIQAIQQKNLDLVKRLVYKFRPNLNVPHEMNITSKKKMTVLPLLLAVKQSCVDMVEFLIDHGGADVQLAVDDYNAALHYALCHVRGSLSMLHLLLARGANVNATNSHGYTPLHMACMEQNIPGVELLLRFGASAAMECQRGQSPLTIACHVRNSRLVQCLVQQGGADPWLATRYACPVAVAIHMGDLDLLQTLLMNTNNNNDSHHDHDEENDMNKKRMTEQQGGTMAHVAARWGQEEILKWAIQEKKCNVNARNYQGQTPLHVLCQYNRHAGIMASVSKKNAQYQACIRLLVNSGAALSVKDNHGNAPIHYAIQREETTHIVEALLQLGESPEALDDQGRTPLHLVCGAGNAPADAAAGHIRLLAHAGASLDKKDHLGNAPIHYAIQNHVRVLETLLEMGADPNVRNQQGQTALHLFCAAPWALSIPSKLPPPSSPLKRKRKKQKQNNTQHDDDKAQSEIVTLLCAKGANAFLKDKQGNLAMFLAAEQGVLPSAVFDLVCQSAPFGLFEANRQRSKQQRKNETPQDDHGTRRQVKKHRIA